MKPATPPLNIHAVIPRSSVNGPGERTVVFFQGCERRCPGCFNPGTHSMAARELFTIEEVLELVPEGAEGLTVSGGEPFLQARGLKGLLALARSRGLTAVVYTGFTLEDIVKDPVRLEALEYIDVLIDGPFEEDKKEPTLLARGSTNQRFHFLTGRYSIKDLLMPGRVEVLIGGDGVVRETGFSRIILPAAND